MNILVHMCLPALSSCWFTACDDWAKEAVAMILYLQLQLQ